MFGGREWRLKVAPTPEGARRFQEQIELITGVPFDEQVHCAHGGVWHCIRGAARTVRTYTHKPPLESMHAMPCGTWRAAKLCVTSNKHHQPVKCLIG